MNHEIMKRDQKKRVINRKDKTGKTNSRVKRVSKKRNSKKRAKTNVKKFVGRFLQQPARTRSGTRYSKKKYHSSTSNESIFGSISGQYKNEPYQELRISKSESHTCPCKDCFEDSREISSSRSCESSNNGLSISLMGDNMICKKHTAGILDASCGMKKHKSYPQHDMCQTPSKKYRKSKSSKKAAKVKSRSTSKLAKNKTQTKRKIKNETKTKTDRVMNKKEHRVNRNQGRSHAKSSSLLQFILKKRSGTQESNATLKHKLCDKESSADPCKCCKRYQKLIRDFSQTMMLVRVSLKDKKLPARYNLLRLWKPCLQPQSVAECETLSSESEDTPISSCRTKKIRRFAPVPRASTQKEDSSGIRSKISDKWQSLSKIVQNIHDKRTNGLSKVRNIKLRPLYQMNYNVPMPSCGPTKKKNVRKKKRKSISKKRNNATKIRTGRKRAPTEKLSRREKIDAWKLEASRNYQKREDLRDVLNKITESYLAESKIPMPSSRVPTFIAMVKTAIRDLAKFHMTSRKAISKYIALRYRVQNEPLLKFALKWMTKMGVIAKTNGLYYFTSKKAIKKSKCVGKVKKGKKKPSKKKKSSGRKGIKMKKHRKKNCSKDKKRKKKYGRSRNFSTGITSPFSESNGI